MPLIDDIKDSHSMLKGKTFKEKCKYFKDYYLLPTVIGIAVFMCLFFLIRDIVTNKDIAFEAAFINSFSVPDSEKFSERININQEKEEAFFDGSFYMDFQATNISQTNYDNAQKLMAIVASAQLDVIVCDRSFLENYLNSEFYGDIRNFYTEEELAELGDLVIRMTPYDEEEEKYLDEFPCAIDVTNAPQIVNNFCFPEKEAFLIFLANTKRVEFAKEFYRFLNE